MNAAASQLLVLFLWQAAWQAGFVLAAAWLLSACLPGAVARARLLHGGLVLSCLSPLASALLPRFILLATTLPPWVPLVDASGWMHSSQASAWEWAALLLAGVWILGVVCQSLRIVHGWVSRPLQDERCRALLEPMAGAGNIELRTLPGLDAPFCWQVHRPVLVLSERLLARSDEDLTLLLRHEVAHLRSGDPLRLFVEHCVLALLWFHPLVYWIARKAQAWREVACDEWAVADGASSRTLARLLTELAELAALPRPHDWQLSASGAALDLQLRIRRLTDDAHRLVPSSIRSWFAQTLLLALVVSLTLVRVAGPSGPSQGEHWTHWPPATSRMLDVLGVQTVDFDLRRARRDPREQRPEHRAAHRKWTAAADH
jgi:hypothetical protein